ncbi:MAG: tRNA-dihydrouridine synthase [Candidatus Paceibacterota bacterium]
MKKNFWQTIKKPIIALAPMADVTDVSFRYMIAKYGKPDVMWTEFVSADGLVSAGYDALVKDLQFNKKERPIIAQFFTATPENMKKAAEIAVKLGFDGIDINMGCPDKGVQKQGAGAMLIKSPKLARETIRAAQEGVAGKIPVSVKTRIGYTKNELATWLPEILAEEPAAVTVHARTKKELSLVPARWEHVREAVEIRDSLGSKTLILGNGDIKDLDEAFLKVHETGADGVMIGRGFFGTPWLCQDLAAKKKNPRKKVGTGDVTIPERLKRLVEHTKYFEKHVEPHKNFLLMKKHFKAYVSGFDGAKELRVKLMEAKNSKEISIIIKQYIKNGLK